MPGVCPRNTPGFSRNAITTAGSRPSATMLQRKNAIENGGTLPATPRAKIMLETCAVATSRKPEQAQHFARSAGGFSRLAHAGSSACERYDVRHAAAYRLAITASNALPIAATGGFSPVNNSNASAA